MRDALLFTLAAFGAAAMLYEMAVMLTGAWPLSLTWLANRDGRVFVLLLALLAIAAAHLIYERMVNGV